MKGSVILVVEDEAIVAQDIRDGLMEAGYSVPLIVDSGERAVQRAAELGPDLVLMDICMRGTIDGVEAARRIRERFDIPVVYLTAFADESVLRRARETQPYGYVIKPYGEDQLHTSIEIALDRYRAERNLREIKRCYAAALECSGMGVIATDCDGSVVSINPETEALTGWSSSEAVGMDIDRLFSSGPASNLFHGAAGAAAAGLPDLVREAEMIESAGEADYVYTRGGAAIEVQLHAGAVRNERGEVCGVVLAFRPADEDEL